MTRDYEDFTSDHKSLKSTIKKMYSESIEYIDGLSHQEVAELGKCYPDKMPYEVTVEKLKIMPQLLRKTQLIDNNDLQNILSYMTEKSIHGWHDSNYNLGNDCLRFVGEHCKQKFEIRTPQSATSIFRNIQEVFFDKEYGKITQYIFSYCIAALFVSKLKQDSVRLPFFLQIACERGSVLYSLIHEIVEICDVNKGVYENCKDDYRRKRCDYDCLFWYPTESVERDLSYLMSRTDIPVIIDGTVNNKRQHYNALLKRIANIPNIRKRLDIKDRFNILPIFITPQIEENPRNVINMDLSDLLVDEDYLELIRSNKQMLSSWIFQLVNNHAEYLFPAYFDKEKQICKYPFSDKIHKQARRILSIYTDTNQKDAENIGVLSSFFTGFMNVFSGSIYLLNDDKFLHDNKLIDNPNMLIDSFIDTSERSLCEVQNSYSPILYQSENVTISDSLNEQSPRKSKQAHKDAKNIAINMCRYYLSYGTAIGVTHIDINKDRYIFDIKLIPGTPRNKVFKHAKEVQMLLEMEYFRPVYDHSAIKIIAADKMLKENSLTKILESSLFSERNDKIPYAIGYDIMGGMHIVDIAQLPHLLIAGSSNSGKSVALASLLMSIAYKQRTGDVNILAFDFIDSHLSLFDNVPILSHPIIKDTKTGFEVILKLKDEQERRERLRSSNYSEFSKLPFIVCIIDEFQRLLSNVSAKENKILRKSIQNLLERGRHSKIHMILATQDPSKKNMECEGLINITAGIALKCPSFRNSISIIGEAGAENLLGKGDMLFKSGSHIGLLNLQGSFIDDKDIPKMLDEIPFKLENKYRFVITESEINTVLENYEELDNAAYVKGENKLLADIILWALGKTSISARQIVVKFRKGDRKANEIMDKLYELQLIDAKFAKQPRNVLPNSYEDLSQEVKKIFSDCGYSIESITNAIDMRTEKL